MPEFIQNKVEDNDLCEANNDVWALVNEVFDEEEAIDKEAARFFNVKVDYIRTGHLTHRIENWIKERRKEAGWEYLEK